MVLLLRAFFEQRRPAECFKTLSVGKTILTLCTPLSVVAGLISSLAATVIFTAIPQITPSWTKFVETYIALLNHVSTIESCLTISIIYTYRKPIYTVL